MEIEFFACQTCGKIDERQIVVKNITCPRCNCKRFHPVYLGVIRMWVYLLTHPKYIIEALKEE